MSWEATLFFVAGAILPSFIVAVVGTWAMRYWAPRWGLIDQPNQRKVHVTPIPLGGGVGIALGVVVPLLVGSIVIWLGNDETFRSVMPAFAVEHRAGLISRLGSLWVLLGGALALMLLGLADDRRGLDWRLRIAVQFSIAAACVITQGWQLTLFIDIPRVAQLISVSLSVIWIVALINSFNMLDNMDGLSSGVAAITAMILAAVLLIAPDPLTNKPQLFVAGFLLVLVGSLLGFLCHNRPPARIFMGDAGSYFIGFCIAISTLLATYTGYSNATAPHAILAPLCVMAVPLYDMTTVIWIRLREGRSPFEADKNHFSHRLVELGLSKTQAVLTIYLTTATCGLGALLLHQVNLFGAMVIVLSIVCVLLLIAILESTRRGNGSR